MYSSGAKNSGNAKNKKKNLNPAQRKRRRLELDKAAGVGAAADGGAAADVVVAAVKAVTKAPPKTTSAERLMRAELGSGVWNELCGSKTAAEGNNEDNGEQPSAALAQRFAKLRKKMKVSKGDSPSSAPAVADDACFFELTSSSSTGAGTAVYAPETAESADKELLLLGRLASLLEQQQKRFALRLSHMAEAEELDALIALCDKGCSEGAVLRETKLVGNTGLFFVHCTPVVWCLGGFASHQDCISAARKVVNESKKRRDASKPFAVVAATLARLKELGALDPASSAFASRLKHLFPSVEPALREKLQLDQEAAYSVSDERTAAKISRIIKQHLSNKTASIVDATACVGGNVVAFSRDFGDVVAIELDSARHGMLKHNLDLLLSSEARSLVRTMCADAVKALPKVLDGLSSAVVFLDPPWGGLAYKAAATLRLELGGLELGDVAALCAKHGARDVALKLPWNAHIDTPEGATLTDHEISQKMKLTIIHFPR